MSHVSKTNADRLTFSRAVVAAIDVQGEAVAREAQRALFRSPSGVDVAAFVRELGQGLRESEGELREKDAAYLAQLAALEAARIERDTAESALREILGGAAGLLTAAVGAKLASRLGLGVALERRPDLLVTQARNVARLLTQARLPAPKAGAPRLDVPEIAAWIVAGADAVASAIDAVERDRREAERTMLARDEAALRWEQVYSGVAEIFVGLAMTAGRDELAARIRPTSRRRAGTAVTEEPILTEPQPEPEPTPEPQPEPEPIDA